MILETLAEYRVLSVSQLERFCFVSRQMTRRWIREAEKRGLIARSRGLPVRRGRPEDVVALTGEGLKELGITGDQTIRNRSHQLLISETRLALSETVAGIDGFELLGAPPQLLKLDEGQVFVADWIFGLRKAEKSLLFFLEADRGTEAVTGRSPRTVRGKVSNYQQYFREGGYRWIEEEWECAVSGFRTLIVCPNDERASLIHRVLRSLKGVGFVWVSSVPYAYGARGELVPRFGVPVGRMK